MGFWERWVVIGEVAKDFGMKLGSWDWVCTSSASPNTWGSDLGDLCVMVGLCRHPEATGHVIETCMGSPHHYRERGVHTEAAQCMQHALLDGNPCVASQSRDYIGFHEGGVMCIGGGCRGRRGGVKMCCGCRWVCTNHMMACNRARGVCTMMLGVGVGVMR